MVNDEKENFCCEQSQGLSPVRSIIRKYRVVFITVSLAMLTFCAFNTILENDFIGFDDSLYVTQNSFVQQGLTTSSIRWAFSTFHTANWYPLTWLSHMLDVQLYGLRPGGHHLTSLLIHICNVLLLFGWLRYTTGSVWRSALAAALFAIHPLRVESVAWAAERKDILSGLFGLLTLWAYVFYVRKPNLLKYVCVFISLALGLMCKAMLVTWPLILLLLDIWPLRRWKGLTAAQPRLPGQPQAVSWITLLREKIPLAVLVGAFCIIAFVAQKVENAVVPLQYLSFPIRLLNMFISYAQYVIKTFYPVRLAVYYPYQTISLWIALLCFAGFILFCGIAVMQIRRRPFCTAGWFWFVMTLLPVIGLVQIGNQALADRYTYLPSIGLSIAVAWMIGEISQRKQMGRRIAIAVSFLILISLLGLSWRQTYYWKDSLTLFSRTLEITENNWVIEQNYAVALKKAGDINLAEKHVLRALQLYPDYPEANAMMGALYLGKKEFDRAETCLRKSLQVGYPHREELFSHLGMACAGQKKYADAENYLQRALKIHADFAPALYTLADVYRDTGNIKQALETWKKILVSDSTQTEAMVCLAWVMATSSDPNLADPAAAMRYATGAVEQAGNNSAGVLDVLAAAYARQGDFEQAVKTADLAIQKAESKSLSGLAADIRKRKQCYENKKAWLEEP
jgi:tetratricopeptide (TPR) repeat protein